MLRKLKYSSGSFTAPAECAASACLTAPGKNEEASPRRLESEEGAGNRDVDESFTPTSWKVGIIPPH